MKNPHYVRNLRPITLLNIDFKLLTKVLASRTQKLITDLITGDQNAFIKKRFIGNNILDLYSIIAAAEENDDEALLLLLDIEKAFDTVKWSFIIKVMEAVGFPPSFVDWIRLMQTGKELRLFNNRHGSAPIYPQRGVAQGCAYSPQIFIICMEMLANVIRTNDKIQGIKCIDKEKKINLAADDTMLVFLATEQCMMEVNNVLDKFAYISGLKVNYTKTIATRIGKNLEKGKISGGENFTWIKADEPFTYLGLQIRVDSKPVRENFPIDHQGIIHTATKGLRYSYTGLTGKIVILKSLVASKQVYRFSLLPSPLTVISLKLTVLIIITYGTEDTELQRKSCNSPWKTGDLK